MSDRITMYTHEVIKSATTDALLRELNTRRWRCCSDHNLNMLEPWYCAECVAAAKREGVLIGVRAGIEAARELFVFRGLPQDGPPYIYEHEAREMVEALDAQAIAERACKGGSGE